MKSLAFLFLAVSLHAQTLITITGPVNRQDGSGWTGTILLTNSDMLCGAVKVPAGSRAIKVKDGALPTTQIYATTDCLPAGSSYLAEYTPSDLALPARWTVATAPTTIPIASVESIGAVRPDVAVNLNRVTFGPVAIGEVLTRTINGWAGSAGGGGTWGSIGGTLASQTDLNTALGLRALANHLHTGVYEPVISTGSAGQFWSHDKTWATPPSYSLPAATSSTRGGVTVTSTSGLRLTGDALEVGGDPTKTGAWTFLCGTVGNLQGLPATGYRSIMCDSANGNQPYWVDPSGTATPIGGSYSLPTASDTVLGGVKVGTRLSINGSGVLSVDAPLASLTGVIKATSGTPAVVTGSASDCVKVDGSSGACGSAGSLPSMTSNSGKVLVNDGTNAIWLDPALLASSSTPGAPTSVAGTAGNASASIAFSAPASSGWSSILDYTCTSSPGSITVTGSASPLSMTGLTNSTAYTATCRARNAFGQGAASSASASFTPAGVVTTPTFVQACRNTNYGASAQTGITCTFPSNITSGNKLVACSQSNSDITRTFSGDSGTFTQIVTGGSFAYGAIYVRCAYVASAGGGGNTITVTHAASNSPMIWAFEVAGSSGLDVYDSVGLGANGANTPSSNSITTTGVSRLLVGTLAEQYDVSTTAGLIGGATGTASNIGAFVMWGTKATAGAATAAWSLGGTPGSLANIFAFKP